MKKLLTFLAILVTFNAYSQNTVTLPSPTFSFAPSFRYYGTLLDTLRQTWMQTPDGGWNRVYTATEVSKFFKSKADSINNTGYVTHGYLNAHGGNTYSNGYGLNLTSFIFKVDSTTIKSKASALADYNNLITGINNRITTNSGQTGLTGNKATSGDWLFNSNLQVVDGVSSDQIGPLGVTMPGNSNTYSYLGFTRSGQFALGFGLDATNHFVIGTSPGRNRGATIDTVRFAYDPEAGDLTISGAHTAAGYKVPGGVGSNVLLDNGTTAAYGGGGSSLFGANGLQNISPDSIGLGGTLNRTTVINASNNTFGVTNSAGGDIVLSNTASGVDWNNGTNYSTMAVASNLMNFGVVQLSSGKTSGFVIRNTGITALDDLNNIGIIGSAYFGRNGGDNAYVQAKYVDSVASGGGGSSFYQTFKNQGTPLTQRANANYTYGMVAVDNSPNTDVKADSTVLKSKASAAADYANLITGLGTKVNLSDTSNYVHKSTVINAAASTVNTAVTFQNTTANTNAMSPSVNFISYNGSSTAKGIRLHNTATASYSIFDIQSTDNGTSWSNMLDISSHGLATLYNSSAHAAIFDYTGNTADRTYTLPDKSGTVAMTSDIVTGYGPSDTTATLVTKSFAARYPLKSTTIAGFSLRNNITLGALSVGYGFSGSNYDGSTAQSWKADSAALQTVLNLFPKADGRYYTKTLADGKYALLATTISPGNGLSGGGSLSANRILSLDTTIAVSKTFAGRYILKNSNATLLSLVATHKPASTFQTGAGTALTDSIVVKNAGTLKAISPTSFVAPTQTVTLTNKRITKRIGTVTSSATPTPDGDNNDEFTVTALAANATVAAPTGTPTDGQSLLIRIKDNATARTLAWNAIYRAGTDLALPTTTVISKTQYLQFAYNAADSKWDFIGLTTGF